MNNISYATGITGFYVKCSQCKRTISSGEDVMIPIETIENSDKGATTSIHPAICIPCFRKNMEGF